MSEIEPKRVVEWKKGWPRCRGTGLVGPWDDQYVCHSCIDCKPNNFAAVGRKWSAGYEVR